jgi:predicted HicB family RNase H-like nuclease
MDEPRIKTTLRIPVSVRERLRLEAEALNKSLTDLIAEKLSK